MLGSKEFIATCKKIIADYYNEHKDKTDVTGEIGVDDVFEVWYCKSLQNHKALLSTTSPDGMYYEMTFNGDRNELYMDAYKKWGNKCIKLS